MDEELKRHLDSLASKIDSAAEAFAAEIGSLHTQIAKAEDRIVTRMDAIDARQRHDAGLTTTLMELVLKQNRWHDSPTTPSAI